MDFDEVVAAYLDAKEDRTLVVPVKWGPFYRYQQKIGRVSPGLKIITSTLVPENRVYPVKPTGIIR